jgi:hypothetical protein
MTATLQRLRVEVKATTIRNRAAQQMFAAIRPSLQSVLDQPRGLGRCATTTAGTDRCGTATSATKLAPDWHQLNPESKKVSRR